MSTSRRRLLAAVPIAVAVAGAALVGLAFLGPPGPRAQAADPPTATAGFQTTEQVVLATHASPRMRAEDGSRRKPGERRCSGQFPPGSLPDVGQHFAAR